MGIWAVKLQNDKKSSYIPILLKPYNGFVWVKFESFHPVQFLPKTKIIENIFVNLNEA